VILPMTGQIAGNTDRVALIAGRGRLPELVDAALRISGNPPLIAALADNAPETLRPTLVFRLETLGSFLAELHRAGVGTLCMAGAIGRPQVDAARIDAATRPMVPRLMQALALGDDGALRIVMALFEEAGFALRAAHEICPELLMPEAVLTQAAPRSGDEALADLGRATLAEMGARDQGQACVIRQGRVVAREDARGTDAMLADLAAPSGQRMTGQGGILYKGPKPGQDTRADLPTIGLETARGAVRAGLSGIVLQAGQVFTLERAELLAQLDAAGLFLWGRR